MQIGKISGINHLNFKSRKPAKKIKITAQKQNLNEANQTPKLPSYIYISCSMPRSIVEDEFRGFTKSEYTPLDAEDDVESEDK